MSRARAEILAAARRALGAAEPPTVTRDYRRESTATRAELTERFCERAAEYRARLLRTSRADLAETIARACAERDVTHLVRAPGLDVEVRGVELAVDDTALHADDLAAAGGALTGCALAIAETGTLVLDGSPVCGRRLLTLVPDYHLCVVDAVEILGTVPEAFAALAGRERTGAPLTFVSGPSATSDIELDRVEGVHGPRRLDIVVVDRPRPAASK